MKTDLKKYAIALYESTEDLSGKKLDEAIARFVGLLSQKGLLNKSQELVDHFENYCLFKEKTVKVVATTYHQMTEKERRELIGKLESQLVKKVKLVNLVDEQLLAGLVLQIGDTLIDGSLRTYLKNLKQQLAK